MQKIIMSIILSLLLASTAVAWDNKYETRKQKREKEINKQYPYESITGTRYKYDLNNPADRTTYGVDPVAQIKDSVNPMINIDRSLHQFGGGSK